MIGRVARRGRQPVILVRGGETMQGVAMRARFVVAPVIVVLGAWVLPGGTMAAQTLPTVTVTGATGVVIEVPCPPEGPNERTGPQFSLTRSGDTTAALTVALAWMSDVAFSYGPTFVTFAPEAATATVTSVVDALSPVGGSLTLIVEPGVEYQAGDPSSLSIPLTPVMPSCRVDPPDDVVDPPDDVIALPPSSQVLNPTFTG
jgi:hypothetical protein